MPKICENLPDLPGLVLVWIEAKFCNKIRNVQHLARSTRTPSFCTAPRGKFFETVGDEVDSVAEIFENLPKTCNLAGARSRLDGGHILQVNTQRAVLAEIYPQPQLLHRPASKIFRNGPRRSRQLRRNFQKIFEFFF